MHFTTITASLVLAAATGLSAAAPASARDTCPVVEQGDYVWKLSQFYARKPDGITINSIGFTIQATNNGTLNFNCGAQADSITDDKFYSCGENSFISFAWQGDRSGVLLRHGPSDAYVLSPIFFSFSFCRHVPCGCLIEWRTRANHMPAVECIMLGLLRCPITAARAVMALSTMSARAFKMPMLRLCSTPSLMRRSSSSSSRVWSGDVTAWI